jgi:hypothetical protein
VFGAFLTTVGTIETVKILYCGVVSARRPVSFPWNLLTEPDVDAVCV